MNEVVSVVALYWFMECCDDFGTIECVFMCIVE